MSIKKGTMPPRYDEAFKAGAVKMVTEQGRPVKEVASELGICTASFRIREHSQEIMRFIPFLALYFCLFFREGLITRIVIHSLKAVLNLVYCFQQMLVEL